MPDRARRSPGVARDGSDAYQSGAFTSLGHDYVGFSGTAHAVASTVPGPAAALPFAPMALRRRKRA